MVINDILKLLDLLLRSLLVAGQHEECPQVGGVHLEESAGVLAGLLLVDALVLVDHRDALAGGKGTRDSVR